MSGGMRRRLKSEISRSCDLDDAVEGSAARTRPLSYNEIMLKRQNKKESVGHKEGTREVKSARYEGSVKHSGHHSRDIDHDVLKSSRDYAWKDNSRTKEDKMYKKEDTHGKNKNKESHEVEGRSKHKHEKDVRNAADVLKNDSRGHGRSNLDEYSRDDSRYDNERRRHKDYVAQDRHMERTRGAPEREIKRKERSGEDEKHRSRDSMKKHDSGNRRDSVIPERKGKMDALHSRNDETSSKRRRSRSRERVKDKGRRSRSSSPKKHKKVSSHVLDHSQLSLHSESDKSKQNSDIERNKMSVNGSSGQQRRNGGPSSGLGGYSPRKRKTEAAVKTPSPVPSPERKSAGWDFPPSGGDGNLNANVASAQQLLSQIQVSNISGLAAGVSVSSSMAKPLSALLPSNLSAFNVTSIDSIQLTQATRPMRRLYIDNIPHSASERNIMEHLNDFLLSSGANHVRGTRPCISCMINKEKGQALVEFLTPEDASTALSFDGSPLFGNIVKIRRPKDFVEVTSMPAYDKNKNKNKNKNDMTTTTQSGTLERLKHENNAVSDVVKDSPYKIFIGGIAEGLSSELIMEIISAFGALKAFHFEVNADPHERCAFVEYADQSITLKACAGLNGMKIGGRFLTVAQAVPSASSMENSGNTPFYGIPAHVKSLLETPTPVLKLNNMIDCNTMEFSETDLEDIVEDIRLECSRFGSVVSINVVKSSEAQTAISEAEIMTNDMKPHQPPGDEEDQERAVIGEPVGGVVDCEVDPSSNVKEHDAGVDVNEAERHDLAIVTATVNTELGSAGRNSNEELRETVKIVPSNFIDEAVSDHPPDLIAENVWDTEKQNNLDVNQQEVPAQGNGVKSDEIVDNNKPTDNGSPKAEDVSHYNCTTSNQGATENGEKVEKDGDIKNVFEAGCVLVEFKRTEASCMAAHCLHGRVYDDRVVTIQYVPLSAYRARFPK